MISLKSSPVPADASGAPQTTVSTSKDKATGRRRYSVQGIDLSSGRSRSNKTCAACGATKATRMVTCRPCYEAARKNNETLTCAWCTKTFQRAAYAVAKSKRMGSKDFYCSNPCRFAHQAIKNAPKCSLCARPMPGKRGAKFCSPACMKAAPRIVAEKPKRPKQPRPCARCQQPFVPVSSRSQFCGRTCANEAHALRMVGPGNPHFSTGTSYAKLFREMRPLIIERDGFACLACKAPEQTFELLWQDQFVTRTNLAVHHLDENPANNDPSNLVTLCGTCHAVHHKSATTPWPWFNDYAASASLSMTSKWRDSTTSLLAKYSSTTAS